MATVKRKILDPGGEGSIPRSKIVRALESVHVVPTDGRWAVRTISGDRLTRLFQSRDQAKAFAMELARERGTYTIVHSTKRRPWIYDRSGTLVTEESVAIPANA